MLISPPRGFSIFEVLIVIAIIGISTLLISISISSSEKKKVFKEASRFSTIIQTVSDRAAIFRRPMIINLKSDSYEIRERTRGNWVLLNKGFLSPHTFTDNVRSSYKNDEIYINGMGYVTRGEVSFFLINKNNNGNINVNVFFDELGRVEIQ